MKIPGLIAIALAVAGCGADEASQNDAIGGPGDAPASAERAPTVGKDIADELNSSLDRAKAVEEQALQQKQKVDDALKAAEGDP